MKPDTVTARRLAEACCTAWISRSPEALAPEALAPEAPAPEGLAPEGLAPEALTERYSAAASFSINRGEPMTARSEIAAGLIE